MNNRILAVFHGEHSTWGKVGEKLLLRGFALERCYPCLGESLPESMSEYAGSVVFGGPQSATDDSLPEIRAELDWLEHNVLPSETPVLGICLGAQELARVLGAKVGPAENGRVEIGYVKIEPTDQGCDFLNAPTMFYQWHSETFEIPSGAVHLATSKHFEGQAFSYGEHVHAIEFHPEMTGEMVHRWSHSEIGSKKLTLPGAQSAQTQMASYRKYSTASDEWLARYLDRVFGSPGA